MDRYKKAWATRRKNADKPKKRGRKPGVKVGPLSLCGQLEDSILLLENRISNVIAKINSLM